METLLTDLLFVGFFATFVVTPISIFVLILVDKWGITEWCMVHSPNDFIYKLLGCNFCRTFWISLVITFIFFALSGKVELMLCPIVACNVGRVTL